MKRIFLIAGIIILVVIGATLFLYMKSGKVDKVLVLGQERCASMLNLNNIKSVCLTTSPSLLEGTIDYKEKGSSPNDEFWQWNSTLMESCVNVFQNEQGASFALNIFSLKSQEDAISKYAENLNSISQNKLNTYKEIDIGNKGLVSFSPKGEQDGINIVKANFLLFVKDNKMVYLSDASRTLEEDALNCNEEQLIQLGKLIEGKM